VTDKFLIVGLGSMGKRRIRNLQHLGAGELLGFDPRADRRAEVEAKYGVRCVESFEKGLEWGPGALVISTPPDMHVRYARAAAESGRHFFTEASVVDDGLAELDELVTRAGVVAAPSCTMRFHPSIRAIKSAIDDGSIGRVVGLTYHSGQYLPDWHPWEDIADYYVSKRETGGCREIVPFELTWLTWALGDVRKISCFRGKVSDVPADIDDWYQMLLEFESGVLGHLTVDVVSRVAVRVCRVVGTEGVVEWSWEDKRVRVFRTADNAWANVAEPEGIRVEGYLLADDMYIAEMDAFVRATRGQAPYPYTIAEDRRMLELLYAAERSSDDGVHEVTAPAGVKA